MAFKIIDNFKFIETSIKDVYIIEPTKYGDKRGYFMETYKESSFTKAGLNYKFIQENQSKSKKGVVRGLHFQKNFPQAKLGRCIEGEVFDVCVDLRKNSPTFGKWFGTILSAKKGNQFLIPKGFAHGFIVLSKSAVFCYKCDEFYHPEDEGGIIWNDSDIQIKWPNVGITIISDKDKKLPPLKELIADSDPFFI